MNHSENWGYNSFSALAPVLFQTEITQTWKKTELVLYLSQQFHDLPESIRKQDLCIFPIKSSNPIIA